jgi:hypothetical protein
VGGVGIVFGWVWIAHFREPNLSPFNGSRPSHQNPMPAIDGSREAMPRQSRHPVVAQKNSFPEDTQYMLVFRAL